MAHQLDSREFVLRLDPKGMYAHTMGFIDQCRTALDIAQRLPIELDSSQYDSVVLTGLGGSAAGGDVTRALFEAEGRLAFQVNRDYSLPNYVSSRTLVFATSYSGNTEETLSAYDDAKRRGASVICVTSGGQLADRARTNGDALIIIPGGQPPRTALGFMLIPVISACEQIGLLPKHDFVSTFALLDKCAGDWSIETPFESNPAKQLAQELYGTVSVLYGLGGWQGLVANRWKGQINENAKNMTFANAFPELNHNEILGWAKCETQNASRWAVVLLKDGTESPKMNERARVTFDIIKDRSTILEATAVGSSLLERILSLTFMGDFVSLYLAALNEVDPENIDAINTLKSALAKID